MARRGDYGNEMGWSEALDMDFDEDDGDARGASFGASGPPRGFAGDFSVVQQLQSSEMGDDVDSLIALMQQRSLQMALRAEEAPETAPVQMRSQREKEDDGEYEDVMTFVPYDTEAPHRFGSLSDSDDAVAEDSEFHSGKREGVQATVRKLLHDPADPGLPSLATPSSLKRLADLVLGARADIWEEALDMLTTWMLNESKIEDPGPDSPVVEGPVPSAVEYFNTNKENLMRSRRDLATDQEWNRAFICSEIVFEVVTSPIRPPQLAVWTRLLRRLALAFRPESKSSLHQVCRVLRGMISSHPVLVAEAANLLGETWWKRFITVHVPSFLHDPSVAAIYGPYLFLFDDPFIVLSTPAPAATAFAVNVYGWLTSWHVFSTVLVPRLQDTSFPMEHVEAACDTLVAYLPALATMAAAKPLLAEVGRDGAFLENLVAVVAGHASLHAADEVDYSSRLSEEAQLRAERAMQVLSTVIRLAHRPDSFVSAVATMPSAPRVSADGIFAFKGVLVARMLRHLPGLVRCLEHVHEYMHRTSNTHLEPTRQLTRLPAQTKMQYVSGAHDADRFKGVRFTGYTNAAPFGSFRLSVLEVLCAIVEEAPALAIKSISLALWKYMVVWILEYRHNNLLHVAFYRLWYQLVRQNNDTLIELLKQGRVLGAFLEHYKAGPNSSAKAVIMRCMHALRLQAASLPPTSALCAYLKAHGTWQELLPIMLEDARRQLAKLAPVPSANPFAALMESKTNEAAEGLDLGSTFADALGFQGVVADETDTKKKRRHHKKKGKKGEDGDSSGEEGGDGTADSETPATSGSGAGAGAPAAAATASPPSSSPAKPPPAAPKLAAASSTGSTDTDSTAERPEEDGSDDDGDESDASASSTGGGGRRRRNRRNRRRKGSTDVAPAN